VALDAKIKRKATMASTISASSACNSLKSSNTLHSSAIGTKSGFEERGHGLEKLEFALAFAEMRGETERCLKLRAQIAALGGNAEEPGT
jgi:hypothetical protein